MIDLGKYASTVLSAYAVSLILLVVLVAMTARRNAKVKKRLSKLEEERHG